MDVIFFAIFGIVIFFVLITFIFVIVYSGFFVKVLKKILDKLSK